MCLGQVPAGPERGGGGTVHAEPHRRVGHGHHGRHGGEAPQPRPVLAQIISHTPSNIIPGFYCARFGFVDRIDQTSFLKLLLCAFWDLSIFGSLSRLV